MAGPAWAAGGLAAVMIVIAAYSATRLALSGLRRRETEFDSDGVHVLMGVAMAGMLEPRLSTLPRTVWLAIFAVAAAWFAWQAARARIVRPRRCAYPLPHLVESVAMIYMLLPGGSTRLPGGTPAMAMPAMNGSSGGAGHFPALALVLALFMLGYIIWTADRLTSLSRAPAAPAAPRGIRQQIARPGTAGPDREDTAHTPGMPGARRTGHAEPTDRPVLSPRLAACCKIAMSMAMGYMLILMV